MTCPICKNNSFEVLQGIKDYMNQVPYEGKLFKCSNLKCSLIFMDPLPDEKIISSFYHSYYTHTNVTDKSKKQSFSLIQRIILKLGKILFFLIQFNIYRQNFYTLNLNKPKSTNNKLLEIGCGSGERLKKFQNLGWETTGQEIDTNTKLIHEENQLNVYYGSIETLNLPKSSYDIIILNHVLEHLDNPISVLDNCYMLLKSNGTLLLTTPNSNSYGAKIFQKHWGGYDFPRHLFIYSADSLRLLVKKTKFDIINQQTVPWNTETLAAMSLESKKFGCFTLNPIKDHTVLTSAFVFQIKAYFQWLFNKEKGDELFFILQKKSSLLKDEKINS